ncbi:A/G-specific adenine glycosylase [Altererythrobacter sp. MF3-039]|uniref:A/G-specific adenine glycosylase n=1 Tax=Altererythrobacter sp. MF3-039 TaxID=3252901 RepID=UPI00390C6F70
MTASTETIASTLLRWYDSHARDLPWRNPPGAPLPGDPDWPYRVWLSEVMLQQTTVAAVKPYYEKFLKRWPSVGDLAAAEEADVMAEWAGLGYYSRARNLHACARQVIELGGFPSEEAELRKLPGVGRYIAAAVASIAFGKHAVVVDANVERIVSRLFSIEIPLPKGREQITIRSAEITPRRRAGDFAQAQMDLGSTLCATRNPKCLLCPLSGHCQARQSGEPERYPMKAPKKAKPLRKGTAWWIERHGSAGKEVWLETRPGKGMLGGMRALPDDGWSASGDGGGEAPITGETENLGLVRHTFTHVSLELSVVRIVAASEPSGEGQWWPLCEIEQAGLPTLFAKAARLALAGS